MVTKRRRDWFGSFWDRLLLPPKNVRPMSLVAAQGAINPFELFWLIGICIVGGLYLSGLTPPSSIRDQLPPLALKLWAVNLGVGGLIALVGGLSRRALERGLMAYQVGWGQVGLATFVYGLALFISVGTAGMYTALMNILWSVACAYRIIQVQRFLALTRRVQADGAIPAEAHLPILLPKDTKAEEKT